MTLNLVLWIAAIVLWLLAAFSIGIGRLNLIALGLALAGLTFIV